MVLAAGYGTRLRPLTDELPKPLVPIGDRPMLGHIAAELARGGVERLVVNTHHLPAAFRADALADLGLPCELVHEPTILGTAGGVANAASWLGAGDVLVWGGDVLCRVDLAALHAHHRATGAAATLLATPRAAGLGTLGLDAEGCVVRLRGERFGAELAGADFTAVQILAERLRRELPSAGCIVGDGYLPWLRAGRRDVRAALLVERFDDIGDPASYLAANLRWLGRRGVGAWVSPAASVAPGVELCRAVVGAGAVVGGSGVVCDAVVWPGARARAPLERAIVLTSGRVVQVPPST
ncbi:MAG: NTP transferase domain-containing protein [Polyangiaceae bacterium]|nr:NTP transferase domain-containing protein [Polyangiaceae bacterium]